MTTAIIIAWICTLIFAVVVYRVQKDKVSAVQDDCNKLREENVAQAAALQEMRDRYTEFQSMAGKHNELAQTNAQLDQQIKEKLNRQAEVNTELADKTNRRKEIEQQIDKLNEKRNSLNLQINSLEKTIEFGRDKQISSANKAATAYREKLYNEITQDAHKLQENLVVEKEELVRRRDEIQAQVNELIDKRDAFIDAQNAQLQEREQLNFYKIQVTDDNLKDIHTLRSIEHLLYNKDPLYKLIWSTFYQVPVRDMLNRIIGPNKTSGIYLITNLLDNKLYVGQSIDLHTRLTNHCKAALGISTIAHQTVHDAMAKDGLENFAFRVLEKCPKEELNDKEKKWINVYASDKYGYNKTAGGS